MKTIAAPFKRQLLKMTGATFFTFLLNGCNMTEKTWIETMLSEMENAWVRADNAQEGHTGRDEAVSIVARQYFRPGMPKSEAFNLLHELKSLSFEIREYRHEGVKNWPEGKLFTWESAQHPDAATIKNLKLKYPKGESRFSIWKTYDIKNLIVKNNVAIGFIIKDDSEVIDSVEATLWAESI